MSDLEKAEEAYERNDKRLKIFLVIFLIYMGSLLTFLAVQSLVLQSTIADNQKTNAAASVERFQHYTQDNAMQHDQTQQYVRCIAISLLKPVVERTPQAFEACGNKPSSDIIGL